MYGFLLAIYGDSRGENFSDVSGRELKEKAKLLLLRFVCAHTVFFFDCCDVFVSNLLSLTNCTIIVQYDESLSCISNRRSFVSNIAKKKKNRLIEKTFDFRRFRHADANWDGKTKYLIFLLQINFTE
jgi:hypothetical protein